MVFFRGNYPFGGVFTADNLPYEKVGKNDAVCISDEVPFDIPDSWEWARLGMISTYSHTKQKINAQNADPDMWGLDLEDIEKGGRLLERKTVGERKAVGDKTFFDSGDILYSKLRPYLLKILVAPDCGICTPEIVPFKVFGKLDPDYIVAFLKCPYVDAVINAVTYGVKMPRVGTETMTELLVPIPPLSEQKRIVEKLNEVTPLTDSYAEAYARAAELNQEFPELLKKSILQEAVQGKLVPQDPTDEPASVLLERIRAEKEQLIKAGKIKRDKHESVIFRRDNSHYEKLDGIERCIDDEIPFEIPDTWEWVRFGHLYSLTNGTASRGSKGGTNHPVLRLADLSNNIIDTSNVRSICLTEKEFLSHIIQMDDLLFIRVNGSKDRVASAFRYTQNEPMSFCDHLFCGHKCSSLINADYIMFVFNCPFTRKQLIPEIKTTAGQNTISQTSMAKILLPVPPLSEQQRIVDEVSCIMSKIEHL